MKLSYEVISAVGNVRLENQDNFYLDGKIKKISDSDCRMSGNSDKDFTVFAVCDGMGGEDSGEVAASIAAHALHNYTLQKQEMNWNECIHTVNREVCEYQNKYDISMGTTFAGICFSSMGVMASNIGDSRIYRIHEGKIIQISKDHSEYQIMVDAGIQTDVYTMHRARHHLVQFLGMPEEKAELEPNIVNIEENSTGDYYLLCSDGLWSVLPDEQLLEIIQGNNKKLHRICELMVEFAEKQGSRDNITALLIYVHQTDNVVQYSKTEKEKRGLSVIEKMIYYFHRKRMQ